MRLSKQVFPLVTIGFKPSDSRAEVLSFNIIKVILLRPIMNLILISRPKERVSDHNSVFIS